MQGIMPRRACYLQPGDIVKRTPDDRRLIMAVNQEPNKAMIEIIWSVDGQSESVFVPFCRWFTVEKTECQT